MSWVVMSVLTLEPQNIIKKYNKPFGILIFHTTMIQSGGKNEVQIQAWKMEIEDSKFLEICPFPQKIMLQITK